MWVVMIDIYILMPLPGPLKIFAINKDTFQYYSILPILRLFLPYRLYARAGRKLMFPD